MKKKILLILTFALIMSIFTGCGCKHEFSEADCNKPATCELCGKEEGTVTPHTTDFGKCEICGESFNYDVYEKVSDYLLSAAENAEMAASLMLEYRSLMNTDALSYFGKYEEYMNKILACYGNVKSDLENARTYCGSYSELSGVKTAIGTAISCVPSTYGSITEVSDFIDDMSYHGDKMDIVGNELKNVAYLFQ